MAKSTAGAAGRRRIDDNAGHGYMQTKSATGRPRQKRLTCRLGRQYRAYIQAARDKRFKEATGELEEQISIKLKDAFGIDNTPLTVKRSLQRIWIGKAPFSMPLQECVEEVLQSPLPAEIKDYIEHKPSIPVRLNINALKSELENYAPARFIKSLATESLKRAAQKEYYRHIGALRDIGLGRIALHCDTIEYFNHFLQLVHASPKKEKARVFARLLHLEARKKLGGLGELRAFSALKDAVDHGQLDIEYVAFIYGPPSLRKRATKEILDIYHSFASAVFLHYETKSSLAGAETAQTIALLENSKTVLTHGWDYRGNIESVLQWTRVEDYERFLNNYEKIRSQSDPYRPRPALRPSHAS
jgi:hypothetical protein